jgi:DNA polymerase IV
MGAYWTFVDMNSYFASCEQQERPELRGLPVGVVPVMTDTTCFIAASYEAKVFKIKTGTPVWEGKKLCPHIRIIEARPRLYRQIHDKVVEAVHRIVPVHEVMSIDEMVCKPWKNEATLAAALKLGQKVQESIRDHVGDWLSCSVGLAPNVFLAKVASDLQKPRGLSVITPEDIPGKLLGLELTDWPGISHGMEARFHRFGVTTTAEMYRLRIEEMREVFGGIVGERWWKSLRGQTVDLPPIKRYQIGHSNVLAPEFRTTEGATAVVFRMLEKAAERLRHEGFHAQRLEVHVMSATEPFWSRHADFLPCNRTARFVSILRALWNPPTRVPKSVGVNLQKIIPDYDVTLNMFDDPRRANLDAVIDRLNRRYGRTTITRGTALRATKYLSHERIPFGKPSDMR